MMMILKGDSFLLIRSVSHIIILQSCRMLNQNKSNTEVRAKSLITSVTGSFKLKKARVQYRSESKKHEYFGKLSAQVQEGKNAIPK